MWHDNETDLDLIGFHRFATAIQDLVLDQALLPITVGLFGDWGGGKSSVLRMIQEDLNDKEGVLCLRFDGWVFEGYDDAKAALMSTIVAQLEKNQKLFPMAKNAFQRLNKKINWFRALGLAAKGLARFGPLLVGAATGSEVSAPFIPQEAITQSIDNLGEIVKEDKESEEKQHGLFESITEFRSEFQSLMNNSELSALVILVDDLDRCLPDSVVSTLEAIKLFLAVPKTAFIVAADERIVHHAVAQRFSVDKYGEEDLPQQYLEKLIQVRVVLPRLDPLEVEAFVYLLFSQYYLEKEQFDSLVAKTAQNRSDPSVILPINYQIASELIAEEARKIENAFEIARNISQVLAEGLQGNPRQVKRFLNTFSLRIRMAHSTKTPIDPAILAKLMILERFHDETYQELYRRQSEQDGLPTGIERLEQTISGSFSEEELTDSEKVFLNEPRLASWLSMEPALAGINLSSYFNLTKETLTATSLVGRRLPEDSQRLLSNLLSEAKTSRKAALNEISNKDHIDIDPLFDVLWSRWVSSPATKTRNAALDSMIEWSKANERVAKRFLNRLPQAPKKQIVPKIPINVLHIGALHPSLSPDSKSIVSMWATDGNTAKLRKAAEDALARNHKD